MPEDEVFLILDGGGAKKSAVSWLKEACNCRKYSSTDNSQKRISVMNLSEFITWANVTFH